MVNPLTDTCRNLDFFLVINIFSMCQTTSIPSFVCPIYVLVNYSIGANKRNHSFIAWEEIGCKNFCHLVDVYALLYEFGTVEVLKFVVRFIYIRVHKTELFLPRVCCRL